MPRHKAALSRASIIDAIAETSSTKPRDDFQMIESTRYDYKNMILDARVV